MKIINLVLLLLFIQNCTGSRGSIKIDQLKYPVSMSGFLYDKNLELMARDYELKVVETYKIEKTYWGIFFAVISLNSHDEISEELNSIIEKKEGMGIINFTVSDEQCFFNEIPIFNLLPLWPGCNYVTISGEVVQKAEK